MIAAVLFAILGATSARADDASEAQLQYELGVELYNQRRFPEAVERFVASNRLVRNANVVFNIAQTYGLMRRPHEAYNWYETLLTEFEIDDDTRARATAAMDALDDRLAVVAVESTPAGALLYLDRMELGSVGRAPRRLAVAAGPHRLIATLEGHRDASAEVEAVTGSAVAAVLALEPLVGTLVVESEPSGATVHLVTGPAGTTPLSIELPVGSIDLRIEREGYVTLERAATISDGGSTRVAVSMTRAASTVAVLTVAGEPAHARVLLDGRVIGEAPLSVGDLEPGRRSVEVRASGRDRWQSTIVLEPGAATRVEYRLVESGGGVWPGWRWVAVGAGGALLAGGLVVGGVAAAERDAFFSSPDTTGSPLDRIDALNVTADVLVIAGAVTLLATALVELLTASPEPSSGSAEVER